jgi:uncharacterized membrane protein
MSGLRSARSVDLAAAAAAALFALAVAAIADSGPLVAVALLPLVLVLPGYALTAILFPPGTIDRDLRIVLTASLSIAATALSGLVLQIFVDLGRGVVAVTLAAIVVAAAAAASRERERRQDKAPSLSVPRLPAPTLLAFAAAVAICGVAVAIATEGAERQLDQPHFSGLWLVPKGAPETPPNGPPVVVGASNEERRERGYRLVVRRGGSTVGAWDFRLPADGEWEKTLTASELSTGGGPLVAQLERGGDVYRRVAIELEPGSGGVADG